MAICLKHTDREATTKCITCFKPLCAECAISADGKDFCSAECQQNAASSDQRVAEAAEKSAASSKIMRRKKIIRMLTSLIVIIAVVAGAVLLCKARPDIYEKLKGVFGKAKSAVTK